MSTTIILTSTVNVNLKKIFLSQIDKNERLDTYIKSIKQWLANTNFNIVLVENSGYQFEELQEEKETYKNRFEIISFVEEELEEAQYLTNDNSKGTSEIFSINYAFNHSEIIKNSIFIIKITARYYIPELQEYLSNFDLNNYDCLTQNNRGRCEMVGCHYNNFQHVFNNNFMNEHLYDKYHIESVYRYRQDFCNNILICKNFEIEKTRQGGSECYFTDI